MGLIDEIRTMRQQGRTDGEIVGTMKSRGVPESQIVETLSQSKIKDAVSAGPVQEENFSMPLAPSPRAQGSDQGGNMQGLGMQPGQMTQESYAPTMNQSPYDSGDEYSGMQPSMMSQPQEYVGGNEMGTGGGEVYQTAPETGGDYAYEQYQPYQEAMSTDVITEISEQVVNEKLSYLKDRLEGVMDVRTVMEARMSNINERLKRMEKILDQLQLSVLQKVGEYVNDVSDIKKEIQETQKSFVAVQKKQVHHTHPHHEGEHHSHAKHHGSGKKK